MGLAQGEVGGVAQNVLQIERGLYAAFVNLVNTSFTPGDAAFRALGVRFLDLDQAIEERAAAIEKQGIEHGARAVVAGLTCTRGSRRWRRSSAPNSGRTRR